MGPQRMMRSYSCRGCLRVLIPRLILRIEKKHYKRKYIEPWPYPFAIAFEKSGYFFGKKFVIARI